MNIWYIVMINSHLRAQNASECDFKTSNFPGGDMPLISKLTIEICNIKMENSA